MLSFLIMLISLGNITLAQEPIKSHSYQDYLKANTEQDLVGVFEYDKKSKLFYYLANDSENIYFKIVANDVTVQKKILAFGNNLWINAEGGKRQRTGILFPFFEKDQRPAPPKRGQDEFGTKKFDIVKKLDQAILKGFNGEKGEKVVRLIEMTPFELKIYFDAQGKLVQEYKIPFNSISAEPGVINSGKMSLGIVTGFLNTSQMQPPSGSGGQQGPPPGGGNDREMQEMGSPSSVWIRNIQWFTSN